MDMKDTKYDCERCPYPVYRDSRTIFCDICLHRIIDECREAKRGKENVEHGTWHDKEE